MDTLGEERPAEAELGREVRSVFQRMRWTTSVEIPKMKREPSFSEEIASSAPDLIANLDEGTIFVEVKTYLGDRNATGTVLAASAANELRRSVPGARQPRAVLILQMIEMWIEREGGTGSRDLGSSHLQILARQLTAKNGYDGVIFVAPPKAPRNIVLGIRSRPAVVYDDLDDAIDELKKGLFRGAAFTSKRGPITQDRHVQDAVQIVSSRSSITRFLLVADEWNPGKGGITSFNRELAIALVRAGREVCIYLPKADEEILREASELGFEVAIPATTVPGLEGASALLAPQIRHPSKERYVPEVVIGHGRVLGPHAYYVQGLYTSRVLRVHVVHTHPEFLELAKEGSNGEPRTRLASERRTLEVQLASSADVVAAVGPSLFAWIHDDLVARDAVPKAIEIDPGLRDWGVRRDPDQVPAQREFLIVGRVDDFESKGIELAIRAVGLAIQSRPGQSNAVVLVLRGVPPEHAGLRARVNNIADEYGLDVIFRAYSDSLDEVKTDLRKAIAVMMPSSHEGFGLSAYEAIAIGTPVIITSESGLAAMLKALRDEGMISSKVLSTSAKGNDQIQRWSSLVGRILDSPEGALRNAGTLADELDPLNLWDKSIQRLISELQNVRDEESE